MGNFNNLMTLTVNALEPVFTVQLLQADGMTPFDLTLATQIKFRMRLEEAAPGTLTVNNALMQIVGSPTLGKLKYSWQPTDVAAPGRYLAKVEVDFAVGSPLIFPTVGYYRIFITPDL